MQPALRNFLLVLAGALVLAVGARVALSGNDKPKPPPMVQVLVAARDLPAGYLLSSNATRWQAMQQNAVPKNAILRNDPAARALQGALLHNAVSRGVAIQTGDIISADTPGFLAAALKPGMRAVSVAINDVSGNAGLIQPGDYVDLLLTQTMQGSAQNPARSVVSETIATMLRVIAVGSTLQRPRDNDGASPNAAARTVTLEVTPRSAEAINVAARLGDLSLALRSFAHDGNPPPSTSPAAADTDADAGRAPMWAGDISQAARAAATPSVANPTVLVLRGSNSGSATAPVIPQSPVKLQ